MTRAASLPVLPSGGPASEPADGAWAAALLMQSVEDLDLAERVGRALAATGYGPLRDIQVTVQTRLVILAGQAPSYHLKQVAQAATLAVPGVDRVRNDLEVGRPG
jgi:osmotically-inducible protein OsmY